MHDIIIIIIVVMQFINNYIPEKQNLARYTYFVL